MRLASLGRPMCAFLMRSGVPGGAAAGVGRPTPLLVVTAAAPLARAPPRSWPLQYQHHQQQPARHKHSTRRPAWARQHSAAGRPAHPALRRAAADGAAATATASHVDDNSATVAVGQVMTAEANYVRVDVRHVGPATAAELRDGGADASTSGRSSSVGDGDDGTADSTPRRQLLCTVRALLKKMGRSVLVGDYVEVSGVDWREARGAVSRVLPRRSALADPAVANVDHVLLLLSLAQPPFEAQQVSRFLVSAEAAALPVTLLLGKRDLVTDEEAAARLAQVASWGYGGALALSVADGRGLDAVAARCAGRTSVVAGPSGAGKSSLINALLRRGGGGVDDDGVGGVGELVASTTTTSATAGTAAPLNLLAVGEVSARSGRGKHTTRCVTLVPLPDGGGGQQQGGGVGGVGGGVLADSPGFNQPALTAANSAQLWTLFPELAAAVDAAGGCRFADCAHLAEPGCALHTGDGGGDDAGGDGCGGAAARFERYAHYVKFLAEVRAREDYDATVLQAGKRAREGEVKSLTGRGGAARYEAKLEPKRHRAASRQRGKQQALEEEDDDVEGGDGGR